jgi:hypothetical protein
VCFAGESPVFADELTCERDGVCSVCGERTHPSLEQFSETFFEVTDEMGIEHNITEGLMKFIWDRAKTQRV